MLGNVDSDPQAEIVEWDTNTGVWRARNFDGSWAMTGVQWGMNGDLPTLGDVDGDKRQDLLIYRPSSKMWFGKTALGAQLFVNVSHAHGGVPLPAQADGLAGEDLMLWRASDGVWSVLTGGGIGEHCLPGGVCSEPDLALCSSSGRCEERPCGTAGKECCDAGTACFGALSCGTDGLCHHQDTGCGEQGGHCCGPDEKPLTQASDEPASYCFEGLECQNGHRPGLAKFKTCHPPNTVVECGDFPDYMILNNECVPSCATAVLTANPSGKPSGQNCDGRKLYESFDQATCCDLTQPLPGSGGSGGSSGGSGPDFSKCDQAGEPCCNEKPYGVCTQFAKDSSQWLMCGSNYPTSGSHTCLECGGYAQPCCYVPTSAGVGACRDSSLSCNAGVCW